MQHPSAQIIGNKKVNKRTFHLSRERTGCPEQLLSEDLVTIFRKSNRKNVALKVSGLISRLYKLDRMTGAPNEV